MAVMGVYLTNGEVGERIRELRGHRGLSLEELGESLEVAPGVISEIEYGARAVTARELVEMSRIFGVTTGGLLRREPEAMSLLALTDDADDGVRRSLEIFRDCIEDFHGIEALVR